MSQVEKKITPWEALRQIEWVSGTEDGLYDHHCPYCRRWKRVGHSSDCIVAEALR